MRYYNFFSSLFTMPMLRIIILLLVTASLKAQTVYKTPSGAKYHTANCHMVKNVSEAISLSRAAEPGLQPCKICKPASAPQNLVSSKPQGTGATPNAVDLPKPAHAANA